MEAKKPFKAFLSDLRSNFPDIKFDQFKDDDVSEFEEWCMPRILQIIQKDKAAFEEPFELFGQDIAYLFHKKPAMFWSNIQQCSMGALMSGDIKEKFSKVLDSVKSIWGGSGQSIDEIEKLLGSPEAQSKVSELIEYVMTTRIAGVVTNIIENVDLSDLDVNFDKPEDVASLFQNIQSNPAIQKIMLKLKSVIEEKVRQGEFSREIIMQDIETIKLKLKDIFGDMFNDMLGGRHADVPANVILGNSPEARRARMMARLKRKVNERKNAS